MFRYMLPGKKFTKTLRAFRFVIELLRGHAEELNSYDEMECCFSQLCKTSVLAEHWIKTIKPLFFQAIVCMCWKGRKNWFTMVCLETNDAYFFLQGIITTLDMDCTALTPWRNFQMKHLNLSWNGNMSLVIKGEYGSQFGAIWWLKQHT